MTPTEKQHRAKRRRAAVRHAVFTRAPNQLMRGLLSRVRPGKDFCLNRRTILLDDLPDELCGLTITHLSDLHVGELMTPEHLPHIVEAVNTMGSDIVAVTGDFIDYSNEYVPAVVEAMKQLQAPLGVYHVLGNHDYLHDAKPLKDAFHEAGLNLLLDDVVTIKHEDRRIAIGGTDWARAGSTISRHVRKTARKMPRNDLSLLLAHHPHSFDAACACGIDLTLSGHTHGGQLLLSKKRGAKGSIGLANLGFKYTRGHYRRGASNLFISSGVGSWFPLRFRCPAEITVLELQNTY
ncbi:MAG: metallophosphoesterase [Phycisphaeraceae bacterium]